MRLDKKLNLVFPVETDAGTIYVHSTPISREVFERYFLVVSKAFAAIYGEGLQLIAGPRVAYLMLKKIAEDRGEWDGADGVHNGLIAEIRRLTNVVVSTDRGWRPIPYHIAVEHGQLDEQDVAEVEGMLCFFTCASAMHLRSQLTAILAGMTSLWGAQTTSLTCTEYAASLTTSTVTASSGATEEITLSVPF